MCSIFLSICVSNCHNVWQIHHFTEFTLLSWLYDQWKANVLNLNLANLLKFIDLTFNSGNFKYNSFDPKSYFVTILKWLKNLIIILAVSKTQYWCISYYLHYILSAYLQIFKHLLFSYYKGCVWPFLWCKWYLYFRKCIILRVINV